MYRVYELPSAGSLDYRHHSWIPCRSFVHALEVAQAWADTTQTTWGVTRADSPAGTAYQIDPQ